MKLIRESNDFDWIGDIKPNPFMLHPFVVVFINNLNVTQEEIGKLINLLKESGVTPLDWDDVSDGLLDYGKKDLNAYLKVYVNYEGVKRLGYGTNRLLFEEYKWNNVDDYLAYKNEYIEYTLKDVIGEKNLNESEDDFDWIRSTNPTLDENNQPRVGDVLVCLPGYHSEPVEGFNSEKDDPNCAGFGYAEGRIIVVGSVEVWGNGPEGKRIIVWPDEEESKMYWDYEDEVCFDCGIYGFALTYYIGEDLNEGEEDDFDWVRDVDPNQPVNFNNVIKGKKYRVEVDELLSEALHSCGGSQYIYDYADIVEVIDIDYNIGYDEIYCGSDNTDKVISLELNFDLGEQGEDTFWVTDDMVTLYEIYDDLNESVEDGFDWIRDTGSVFEPSLVSDFNKKGNVVAIWFDYGIDSSTRDYIISFANENGYDIPYALIHYSDEVRALTFYPDKQMGFLKDEESWDLYIQHIYDGDYDDVSSSNLYIIGK